MFLGWMCTCVRQRDTISCLVKRKNLNSHCSSSSSHLPLYVVCVWERERAGESEGETHPQYVVGVLVMREMRHRCSCSALDCVQSATYSCKTHTHTHTHTHIDTSSFFTFTLSTAVNCSMCVYYKDGHTHTRKISLYLRLYGHLCQHHVRHKSCKFAKVMQLKVKTNWNAL